MSDWFQALFLGVLQGLTEFLPISSSAHLRIVPEMFGWGDPGAAFTAVVQIGTEVAVLLYFWKDLWRIFTTWLRSLWTPELRGDFDARMGWYVIVGTIPIVVLGVIFRNQIETAARNLWITGTVLIVFGLVLGAVDATARNSRVLEKLDLRDSIWFGLAQALALVPGVSRSGASVSMGLFLGYRREAATRYAFLLAIPSVIGAGIFQLSDAFDGDAAYGAGPTIAATLVAFVVGYATIAWLLRYISTHSYRPFVIYRVLLGLVVLGLLATGTIEATPA